MHEFEDWCSGLSWAAVNGNFEREPLLMQFFGDLRDVALRRVVGRMR